MGLLLYYIIAINSFINLLYEAFESTIDFSIQLYTNILLETLVETTFDFNV